MVKQLTQQQTQKVIQDQIRNIDLKGRRVINAHNSLNLQDYVTRAELNAAKGTASTYTTSYSDPWAGTDQPFMAGDLWACCIHQISTTTGGAALSGGINRGSTGLNFTLTSSNGLNDVFLFPLPVSWDYLLANATFNYFSQAIIVSDSSAGAVFAFNGPAVMWSVNKRVGYHIRTNSTAAGGNVVGSACLQYSNGSGADVVFAGTTFTYSLGDLLRIEAYPNTPSAGSTTIKALKNGSIVMTFVDSVHTLSSGLFGFYDYFVSSGVTQVWKNFSGGKI